MFLKAPLHTGLFLLNPQTLTESISQTEQHCARAKLMSPIIVPGAPLIGFYLPNREGKANQSIQM
jgi:hypothetical protein